MKVCIVTSFKELKRKSDTDMPIMSTEMLLF